MAALLPPIFDNQSSQARRQLARRLAAYLPRTLTRQILHNGLPQPGQPQQLRAATLFADISGFTRISEALANEGPQGAERLNQALLMTFTPLINAIHDAGGAVSRFHGDAIMVYFPDDDGQAAMRALATARFMQNLVQAMPPPGITRLADGSQVALTIKIGVGYGRCLEMVLGSPTTSMEFVLIGPAVDEAAAAEAQAQSGQIIASRQVLQQARLPASEPFRLLTETPPVPGVRPGLYWEAYETAAIDRLVAAAPAFLPPALYLRLQDASTQSIAEHRPVTSLFVRFSGLDLNEPDTGNRWQAYYQWACQLVARYGGENSRVNHLLTGDKGNQLHIVFGAPVAPDAPEAALRCALAMQQERPDYIHQQQIGVCAGRVFAGAVGSQTRREYTIVGNVVNLSARLVNACPDREVVVDGETAVRLETLFEFGPETAVSLKGHIRPVAVRVVRGERAPVSVNTPRDQSLLLVRAAEQTQLNLAVQRAWAGEGAVIALTGAVGAGIRELSQAVREMWLVRGGQALMGVCEKHRGSAPFTAWQAVWREFWHLTAVADNEATAHVITQAEALAPDMARELAPWLLAMGLSLPPAPEAATRPLDSGQLRLFGVIQAYLAAAGAARPLLLIFEDIQWADQPSRDLLHYLANQPALGSVLIILCERGTAEFSRQLQHHPQATMIPLGELTVAQGRQLVCHMLGVDDVPPVLERRLGLRDEHGRDAAISPFFLVESLKGMMKAGVVSVSANGRLLVDDAALAHLRLPDTIHAWLLSRLDQLPPVGRNLLQIASVIGREFSVPMLTAVASSMGEAKMRSLLQEMAPLGLIEPGAAADSYLFSSALIHDVVYQSLPYARRQTLHSAVADWLWDHHQDNLKPFYTLLAYHLSRAQRHELALEFAWRSADGAAAVFAYREAVELYRLAHFHWTQLDVPETAVFVDLQLAQAKALVCLGRLAAAFQVCQSALEESLQTGTITPSLQLRLLMVEISCYQGRYEQARRMGRIVADRAAANPELRQFGMMAAYWQAMAYVGQQRWPAASETLAQMPLAEDFVWTARILGVRAEVALGLGRPDEAEAHLVEALSLLQSGDDVMLPAQLLCVQAEVAWRKGNVTMAETAVAEAIRLVQNVSPRQLAAALRLRARLLIYEGNFAAAAAEWRVAGSLQAEMEDTLGWIDTHLLTAALVEPGMVTAETGGQALRQAQQLLKQYHRDDLVEQPLRLCLWQGRLALLAGDRGLAARALRQAGTIAGTYGCDWWRPQLYYWQARLKLAEGEAGLARQLLQAAETAVAHGGNPDERPLILLAQAEMQPAGDTQDALLAACISAARRRSRYADRLMCLQRAGQMLVKSSRPDSRQRGEEALAWVEHLRGL